MQSTGTGGTPKSASAARVLLAGRGLTALPTKNDPSFGPDVVLCGAVPYDTKRRRESQPRSAPSTSPASGAKGTSVVRLTTMPSAKPSTAPSAMAAPTLTCASV